MHDHKPLRWLPGEVPTSPFGTAARVQVGFLLRRLRMGERHGLTQALVARQLRSSQSRVAKMEAADRTVSLDLLVRAYFGLGGTRVGMAQVVRRSRVGR